MTILKFQTNPPVSSRVTAYAPMPLASRWKLILAPVLLYSEKVRHDSSNRENNSTDQNWTWDCEVEEKKYTTGNSSARRIDF
jgi:hypothetical protein